MQANRCRIIAPHSGDFLPSLYALPIIYQHRVIMGVSRNVIFTVFNHDEITVSTQLVAHIHHLSCTRGVNRYPRGAEISIPLLPPSAVEYGMITFPVVGHNQQRCPTGGQEDFGTADDGVTDAVLVVDLAVDLRVLLLFAPPSFSF